MQFIINLLFFLSIAFFAGPFIINKIKEKIYGKKYDNLNNYIVREFFTEEHKAKPTKMELW